MTHLDRRQFLRFAGAAGASATTGLGALLFNREAAAAIGDTLTIAYHVPLPAWDATTGLSSVNPQLMSIYKCVFDQYIDQNADLSFRPGLLSEWGWADDDKTRIRMVVREGATWQDGTPVTAQDIIWNSSASPIRRPGIRWPSSGRRSQISRPRATSSPATSRSTCPISSSGWPS